MHWFTALMMYVILWWLTLFAVLPIGTQPIAEAADVPGGFRGVPARPRLLRKIVTTTVLAAVLWVGCFALIRSDWLSFRHGVLAFQDDEVTQSRTP